MLSVFACWSDRLALVLDESSVIKASSADNQRPTTHNQQPTTQNPQPTTKTPNTMSPHHLILPLFLHFSSVQAMESQATSVSGTDVHTSPSFMTTAYSQEDTPHPDFEIKERMHDFGKVNAKKSHTFYITNTGNAPLVIKHVATGCGCTTTDYTKSPILPGKKGKITVSFNPETQRAGAFRKSVTIYTNSPKDYTRVFIKGEVVR